jgi:hypothetical protein
MDDVVLLGVEHPEHHVGDRFAAAPPAALEPASL